MLVHYTFADYPTFKTAFDNDSEDRSNNAMLLMQLWRESNSSAWALFDLHDPLKARAYLDGAAGVFNSQAGITAVQTHMLDNA
ncbi:MAG: hypothetical protein ACK5LJ_01905 [Paracoccus sp. (in: a-proteobacteria)]